MADQATELKRIRRGVTSMVVELSNLDGIASLYTALGGGTFFNGYIDDINGPPDLTAAQMTTAVQALGQLQTWLDNNLDDIVPLMTG